MGVISEKPTEPDHHQLMVNPPLGIYQDFVQITPTTLVLEQHITWGSVGHGDSRWMSRG